MKLEKEIGKEKISEEEIDLKAYASDATQIRGKAKFITWPENEEDVKVIVKYCIENSLNITPRGGGTGLAGGAAPENSVVIDMSRMNKIETKGDEIIAEAGVVLEDLNYTTEKFFPVTPGSKKSCTIGGMIATNAAGMRSIKYGKMENWVEELEIIDGNGDKLKIGKEKIKDFCGKEGTTGIIIKAKLRTIEKPKKRSMSILEFQDITKTLEKVRELKKDKEISAIEYIDKITSKLAKLEEKHHLIVEYENEEGEIKEEKKMQEIWNMRDGLYPIVAKEGHIVIEDPKLELENIKEMLEWLEINGIPTFGHIGMGIIHPHFKKNSEKIEEMFKIVKKLKGETTGEHGIGIVKKEYLEKEKKEEIKKIKEIYDKKNIMNLGKVI